MQVIKEMGRGKAWGFRNTIGSGPGKQGCLRSPNWQSLSDLLRLYHQPCTEPAAGLRFPPVLSSSN